MEKRSYKPPTSTGFTPMDTGIWPAICVAFVDLGTSEDTYIDKTTMRAKIAVGWEVAGERAGEPVKELVWKVFTSSLHEKSTLRKWLESWRGRKFSANEINEFDFIDMLDKPCQVNFMHKEAEKGTRGYVDSVLPAGKTKIKREHPLWFFSFQDVKLDMDVFNAIPDFLRDTIKKSDEWDYREKYDAGTDYDNDSAPPDDDDDGELPF